MSIAIAQMRIFPGQPQKNKKHMLKMIQGAKESNAEMIIFPELCLSGLLLGDLYDSNYFLEECIESGREIAAAALDIKIIFGNLYREGEKLFNSVFLGEAGQLKRLNPAVGNSRIVGSYDIFSGAEPERTYDFILDGKVCRLGFCLGNFSLTDYPFATESPDILVDLSVKPVFLDKPDLQKPSLTCRFISLNCIGMQSSGKTNYCFSGGSYFQNPDGKIVALGNTFTEGLYFWGCEDNKISLFPVKNEHFPEALCMGLEYFLQSINCKRAVIGLSGGVDSALAACIYTQVLGPDNVYLLSMPSRFNSATTKKLAAYLAASLGCPYSEMSIESQVNFFLSGLRDTDFVNQQEKRTSLEISGPVMENIQARDRMRILAATAASLDAIFTCNGNKAELSVGYATFYGDLAGAFAAQADLWKYQVYQAIDFFHSMYPDSPLDKIAALRPSAELSPEQDVEKGLGDPLHYEYHDFLLRSWVEEAKDIANTLEAYLQNKLENEIGCANGLVTKLFPNSNAFITDLEYWWRMYRGTGVAKRLQSPPLLALSSHPFGEPKSQVQGPVWFSNEYEKLKHKACK